MKNTNDLAMEGCTSKECPYWQECVECPAAEGCAGYSQHCEDE